jgi:hypothetical protein
MVMKLQSSIPPSTCIHFFVIFVENFAQLEQNHSLCSRFAFNSTPFLSFVEVKLSARTTFVAQTEQKASEP